MSNKEILQEAIKKAASLDSYEDMQREFPKATMIMDYIQRHYPDDWEKFEKVKMFQYILTDTEHSNSKLEETIDKLAIFNGFKKWGPLK